MQVAIRCHPCVPVASEQLEEWLADQVARLRRDVPHGTVRLSRLCQQLGRGHVPIGWLLELELPGADSGSVVSRIEEAVTDMRLLGLQPTLMTPAGLHAPPNEHYAPWSAGPEAATLEPCPDSEQTPWSHDRTATTLRPAKAGSGPESR